MREAMEEINTHQSLPGPTVPEIVKTETDFDRSEPHALLIAGFGIASVIGLVVVILGIQAYFDHLREQAEYEKVAVPVSQDLKNLHSQEDEELNHYKYLDRNTGVIQIPISRAMELIAQEAATHKLRYFQKPTPVKVPGAAAEGTATSPNANAPSGKPPQEGQEGYTPPAQGAPAGQRPASQGPGAATAGKQ